MCIDVEGRGCAYPQLCFDNSVRGLAARSRDGIDVEQCKKHSETADIVDVAIAMNRHDSTSRMKLYQLCARRRLRHKCIGESTCKVMHSNVNGQTCT